MKRIIGLVALTLILAGAGSARVEAKTVKVGLIMPFSGEFAEWGAETKGGVEVYQHLHGDSVNGNKIEVLYRDEGGINPSRSRQLTTELILRDHVKFLTGYVFSPDALAIADIITQAKVPTIITNAATGFITRKSPYFTRVSFTLQQESAPLGTWAATHGIKTVDAVIANYVAGEDSLHGFSKTFEAHGGKILQVIKYPVTVADISPFYERVLQDKPNAVFIFGTGGANTKIMVGAWAQRLKPAGIRFIGPLQLQETDLPGIGDGAIGVIQTAHYVAHVGTPQNKSLWAEWMKLYGKNPSSVPNMATVSAYDAMDLVYRAVAKFGPNITGDQAINFYKGMKVNSPRGTFTIDPKTRDIVQNIYVAKTEKVHGKLENVVIDTFKNVKDPWKEEHPIK
ncbi:MAG: ABC transporter substrate-binding protein [Stellaceae bacterium]